MKPFPVVADSLVGARRVDLLRKYSRIPRYIESLVRHHGGRLMVAVVLSRNVARHPGDDDLRPGQTNDAHHLIQRFPMPQRFQRMKHVLGWRIGTTQEPDVADAAYR